MRIKINRDIGPMNMGTVVNVKGSDGVPHELYWRRRLQDAEIDNCCEVMTESKPKPEAKADKRKKTTQGES